MADAIVYVDGFNPYYGSLKRTPYKWLDLGRLRTRMLPAVPACCIRVVRELTCRACHRTRPLTSARMFRSSLSAIRAATARISAPMPVLPQNHRCNASSSSLGR